VQKVDPTLRMDEDDSLFRWTNSMRETISMARDGKVLIIDLRPQEEVVPDKISNNKFYLNIPFHELKDQLSALPKRKSILLICRCRFCALSLYAANDLRENGFKAFRFEESWFEINQHYTGEKA